MQRTLLIAGLFAINSLFLHNKGGSFVRSKRAATKRTPMKWWNGVLTHQIGELSRSQSVGITIQNRQDILAFAADATVGGGVMDVPGFVANVCGDEQPHGHPRCCGWLRTRTLAFAALAS